MLKASYILSPSGCNAGDAGTHPHPWLHAATFLTTHKKPPGEKTHFCTHPSEYPQGLNHRVLRGAGCHPCLCQQHPPHWHQQRNPVPDATGGSISHIPIPGGPRTADMKPKEPGRAVYGNLSRGKSFNFYYDDAFCLSLRFHAICSTCGGPTASRHSRWAQGGGTGFGFSFARCLFASTITQTVTSFTRKHWRVLRSDSNLLLWAGGSLFPSSSIIHVLQHHLQHQFLIPFHKLLSLLLFRPGFC